MDKKVAVITCTTGQDSSYLAEFLLKKDYKIYCLKRRTASNTLGNMSHLAGQVEIFEGDLTDLVSLTKLFKLARAHECYHLGAQSDVRLSFDEPIATMEVNGIGTMNCIEAIKNSGYHTRFYNAATSELFGGVNGVKFSNEETPFHPRSPYGISKLAAYWATVNAREAYRMYACNGILFNHESPRRGPNFVTRKITLGIRDIKQGKIKKLSMGNLDSMRDWSHAGDMVRGMWMMLNHSEPGDYVLASGKAHTIRYFCKLAFEYAGLGAYETYIDIDPRLYRPAEVDVLLGDASKAKQVLGWEPEHTFEDLVHEMVDSDLEGI
jgi:GDPmannose 4,6-dehydratase